MSTSDNSRSRREWLGHPGSTCRIKPNFSATAILWLLVSLASGCGVDTPTAAVTSEPTAKHEPKRTRLPGSRVSILVPEGYHRVPHTMTYVHSESQTVVGLVELNFGNNEASSEGGLGVVDAFVEWPGFIEKREIIHDGHDGTLVEADSGRALVLVSGDEVGAVFIRYGRPKRTLDAQVILDSLRFEPDGELDTLAIMGVDVDHVDGLEVRNVQGSMVVFSEPGVEPPMPPGTASFMIIYNPTVSDLSDHELGALVGPVLSNRNVNKDTASLESLTIDGLQGFELTGEGQQEGTPIAVYAVALHASGGVFIMVGDVGTQRATQMIPKLRALARSFRRTGEALSPYIGLP